ncbi:hypothetical protein O4H49_19915 [Kiloniella laminariae]|uniref:Sarcosine oxidase subunit gamma n=1 Tax=Kiloniella laminariae TaxID=454162 RepID=A0ABT4LPN8_9PROT|nr:hypothetical protein [Kiloniella laminariae]MCZ4283061.1 hypothetical protein [Kiloniella laminariae]
MSQLNTLISQHPLEGIAHTGVFGKLSKTYPGVYFETPPQRKIIRLMPFREKAHAVNLILQDLYSMTMPGTGKFSQKDNLTIGWSAKNRWYITETPNSDTVSFCKIKNALSGLAAISDASQGLISIIIDGDDSRALISKGCVLNLSHFLPGDSTPSLMAHTNVHIYRLSESKFEILVPASHVTNFWEWLCLSAEEFGFQVTFLDQKFTEITENFDHTIPFEKLDKAT